MVTTGSFGLGGASRHMMIPARQKVVLNQEYIYFLVLTMLLSRCLVPRRRRSCRDIWRVDKGTTW